jgi:hypothetical protein
VVVEISEFVWTADRIIHIGRHGVEAEEFEEVCFGKALVLRARAEGKNPVYKGILSPRGR